MVFDGRCTRLADIFKCILIKQTIWNLIHAPVHLYKVIHGNEMKSSPLCSLLGNVLRDIKCNPVCWIGSIVVHFILTNIRLFVFVTLKKEFSGLLPLYNTYMYVQYTNFQELRQPDECISVRVQYTFIIIGPGSFEPA